MWLYGALYCKLNNFVSYSSVAASVFTLLAISNDRRKVLVMYSIFVQAEQIKLFGNRKFPVEHIKITTTHQLPMALGL